MPQKTQTAVRKKKKEDKKINYMYQRYGREKQSEQLIKALKPTKKDVMKLLAAQVHIGRRRSHVNMKRYIWKRRDDGVHIINLEKTWAKIILAARIIVTIQNPNDVCVMSTRTLGQRGAIKFAQYTNATPIVGKWVPGTFTNPKNKRAYKEPRLLIVDDPNTCFAALRETSYVGIPTIGFVGVDCNTRFVDCAIPMNNKGKLSIGLIFYLLAREVKRMRGEIDRSAEWEESVDLFFYRTQEEVLKLQERENRKKAAKEKRNNNAIEDEDYGQYENQEQFAEAPEQKEQEEDEDWGDQPPAELQDVQGDDGWGANNNENVDFETW